MLFLFRVYHISYSQTALLHVGVSDSKGTQLLFTVFKFIEACRYLALNNFFIFFASGRVFNFDEKGMH